MLCRLPCAVWCAVRDRNGSGVGLEETECPDGGRTAHATTNNTRGDVKEQGLATRVPPASATGLPDHEDIVICVPVK